MTLPKMKSPKMRNLLYSLAILLPSVLTGSVYSAVDTEQSSDALLLNLSAISTSLADTLSDTQSNTAYRLRLLLSHSDFTSFNIEGMGKQASEFLYYSPNVENIYILDSNRDVIYGTNDTLLSGMDYTNHIDSAFKGSIDFYSTFINGEPFAQFALPIYSSDPTIPIQGAIVLSYDFVPLEQQFKALNSSSVDLQAYLFDANGRLLTSSSNQAYRLRNQTIDIGMIKQGISYAPDTPFRVFDDELVIGTYYMIPDVEWTILLTSSAPEGESDLATQALSLGSGFLGIGSLSVLEVLRKRVAPDEDLFSDSDSTDDPTGPSTDI